MLCYTILHPLLLRTPTSRQATVSVAGKRQGMGAERESLLLVRPSVQGQHLLHPFTLHLEASRLLGAIAYHLWHLLPDGERIMSYLIATTIPLSALNSTENNRRRWIDRPTQNVAAPSLETFYKADDMCSRPTFCARSEFKGDGFPNHVDSAPSTCFVRSSNRATMVR